MTTTGHNADTDWVQCALCDEEVLHEDAQWCLSGEPLCKDCCEKNKDDDVWQVKNS